MVYSLSAVMDSGHISPEALEPVTTGIVSNIGAILPVGVSLLALFIVISLLPRLIKRFLNR